MYHFHPPGIAAVRDGAAATDAKHRVPWHNFLGSALLAEIIFFQTRYTATLRADGRDEAFLSTTFETGLWTCGTGA